MDKRKNSEQTRLERIQDYFSDNWGRQYFLFMVSLIACLVLLFSIVFHVSDTRNTIEKIRDANSAYELCIEDHVHEMCLLEAIEAYN